MDAKLKELIDLFPEKSTQIYDIYEVVKGNEKAFDYICWCLNNNVDLKRAESFFIKIYGKTLKD